MFRHLFPNIITTSIVVATLQLGWFIIAEAVLSFLGLGLQPPTPSWGGIMSEGRQYIDIAWWIETFPGIAMAATVSGIGLLGDWLRDILDPRFRS